jgi:hypothetical protein
MSKAEFNHTIEGATFVNGCVVACKRRLQNVNLLPVLYGLCCTRASA